MKTKRPQLGDKICVNGITTMIVAYDLYQPEAPHFFNVTDTAGADHRVEYRDGVWTLQGAKIKAPKPVPPARVPNDFAKVRNIPNPRFQPVPLSGPAAVEKIKLSAEVQTLHDQLDEARDHYNTSRTEVAWEKYERCILAVDAADPGFYLGRRNPIAPMPRHVPPEGIDFAGISSRATYSCEPPAPEEKLEQVCRLCGCTDNDCSGCIRRTGMSCYWVEPGLCSACAPAPAEHAKMQN